MCENALQLEPSNLLWLKARAIAAHRSLSDVLNELLARMRREEQPAVDSAASEEAVAVISPDDPDLSTADEALRHLFASAWARSVSTLEEPGEK